MSYDFSQAKVLVVDPASPMLALTKSILHNLGFGQIYTARDTNKGFELLRQNNPDIVFAEWMVTPQSGIEFVRQIRNSPLSPDPYVPVIMMTGFSSYERVVEARDSGITEFLVKPFTSDEFCAKLKNVVENQRYFVAAPAFFGPNRRRRKAPEEGPKRRKEDNKKAGKSGPNENEKLLKQMRQQAKTQTENI